MIGVLEHDHREVEEMFGELESLRGASRDERRAPWRTDGFHALQAIRALRG